MRKNWPIALAIFAVVVLSALVWLAFGTSEPMYEGHPLTFWLKGYNTITRTETSVQQADHAVQAAGSNAIPTLLRLLQVTDSRAKDKLRDILNRQTLVQIDLPPDWSINGEAAYAFDQLRADGKTAVPALMEIYQRNISELSQISAIHSLGAIGPAASNAVSVLIQGASNYRTWPYCNETLTALYKIHAHPDLTVPFFEKSLTDPAPNIRAQAAYGLGELGSDAKPALPALSKALRDPDPGVVNNAFTAITKIDPKITPQPPPNEPKP